jgi:hypothetical protein
MALTLLLLLSALMSFRAGQAHADLRHVFEGCPRFTRDRACHFQTVSGKEPVARTQIKFVNSGRRFLVCRWEHKSVSQPPGRG